MSKIVKKSLRIMFLKRQRAKSVKRVLLGTGTMLKNEINSSLYTDSI